MAAIALQRRVNSARAIRNPSVVQLFSSSSSSSSTSNPNVQDQNQNTTQSPSQSSFSSYFSDVKASLKQQSSQQQQRQPLRRPFSTPLSTEKPPSKISSLQEIRKNLSEFHRGATVPPPAGDKSSSSSRPYLSFEEVYKRNIISKGGEEPSNKLNNGGKPSIQAIRERIKQLQSKSENQTNSGGAMSLSKFTESFKLRPLDPNQKESPTVIGGGKYNLPASVFGKEMNKSVESSSSVKKKKRELFMKKYSSKEELGSKLRRLRPERDNNNKWFSLGELNNRLMKLNEIEQKESESRNLVNFPSFKDIVQSLQEIEMCEEEKANKSITQRLEMLNQIGRTPNFMLAPPKENLVEKYFHPDNMSSSEKMKLELQKVRDEFKMSESDCGSSRVQVALLTTKIKHLSTTLHKKDKHSRKGLQAMVQKRKKLLKYLRRTDWDSYCLVLSKLGLRDNPDYKN